MILLNFNIAPIFTLKEQVIARHKKKFKFILHAPFELFSNTFVIFAKIIFNFNSSP